MSSDDWYRRDEQRRADMRAEQRRQDLVREERRQEVLREERRREERRLEERRREALRDEERRRQHEADKKAQEENRKRGMGLIGDGFPIWGAAVLGLDPQRTRPHSDGGAPSASRSAPTRALDQWNGPDRAETPPQQLAAPVLLRFDDVLTGRRRLSWTAIAGATAYVLQESLWPNFVLATEIYRGDRTAHVVEHELGTGRVSVRFAAQRSASGRCYRVMAIGGPGFVDSPWSSIA